MTVSTTSSVATYLGNGVTTEFNIPFIGVDENDIEVIYTDADGVPSTLSPSQYTLFLNPASPGQLWGVGGNVTYPTAGDPIASGTSLTIQRIVPLTQTTSISNQGNFSPTVIERALDTLCFEIQQVAGRTGQLRGTWASGAVYNYGDIVVDGPDGGDTGSYYFCTIANTATTWAADLAAGDWTLAFAQPTVPTDLTDYQATATGGTYSRTLGDHFGDALTPQDFGVIGAGNDTAVIQLALDDGVPIRFPAGTYTLTGSGCTFTAPIYFDEGVVIDMSACSTSAIAFEAAGTFGTFYSLTANATAGSTSATISAANLVASGIVAGDWVQIQSTDQYDPGRTNSQIGELILVESVNTGTGVITFAEPLTLTYNTADTGQVAKANLLENIQVIGPALIKSDNDITNLHKGIRLLRCYNPVTQGVRFTQMDSVGLSIWSCVMPQCSDHSGFDFNTNTTGYLLQIGGSSRDGQYNNISADRVRHLFTTSNSNTAGLVGIPRRHILNGYVAINSATANSGTGGDAIDTHAAAANIHFLNGEIYNASGQGINAECNSGSIINLKINGTVSNGIAVHNSTDYPGNWVISNVDVENVAAGMVLPGNAVSVDIGSFTSSYERLNVSNITASNCDGRALFIDASIAAPITSASISNVQGVDCGDGIYMNGVNNFNVNGFQVSFSSDDGGYGMKVRDCLSGSISSGQAKAANSATSGGAIWFNSSSAGTCSNITVDNVRSAAVTPSLSYGVFIDDDATNITVGQSCNFNESSTPYRLGSAISNRAFGSANISVTAAGSSTSDATQLNAAPTQIVTIVTAGTGVKLGTALNYLVTVYNRDASDAVLVYPPTGAQINSLGTNNGYSLAAGAAISFIGIGSTQWYTS